MIMLMSSVRWWWWWLMGLLPVDACLDLIQHWDASMVHPLQQAIQAGSTNVTMSSFGANQRKQCHWRPLSTTIQSIVSRNRGVSVWPQINHQFCHFDCQWQTRLTQPHTAIGIVQCFDFRKQTNKQTLTLLGLSCSFGQTVCISLATLSLSHYQHHFLLYLQCLMASELCHHHHGALGQVGEESKHPLTDIGGSSGVPFCWLIVVNLNGLNWLWQFIKCVVCHQISGTGTFPTGKLWMATNGLLPMWNWFTIRTFSLVTTPPSVTCSQSTYPIPR